MSFYVSLRKKSWLQLALLIIVLSLASCYSDYVHLDYIVHHHPVWNDEHNKIAFFCSKHAYRKATGISAFPDGGIPEYLLKSVGLYVFNTKTKKLAKAVDFTDLTELLGTSRSKWKKKLVFNNSNIYYSIVPLMGWDRYINLARTEEDSLKVLSLKKKYTKAYFFNINEKQVMEIDTQQFISLYQKQTQTSIANLTELNKKLDGVPLSYWGLVIQDIYPKSDKKYIEETIYRQNTSVAARRAVIEQIISKMDKQEIKALLNEMDEYKNSLKGSEKTEYEFYSKETYKIIQELL